MLSLKEVVEKANEIYNAHEYGAEMDAGFDAGEFSGPAHHRMAEREIESIAVANGFTLEQVVDEVIKFSYENSTWPQE